MKKQPEGQMLARHPRAPVAARSPRRSSTRTIIGKDLTKGTRVMLSGEVGYFKNAMQLTHPDFLILDSAGRKQPRQQVAARPSPTPRRPSAARCCMSAFERRFLPDLSGQHQTAELGHLRLRAPGARGARSGGRSAARDSSCAEHDLVSEDEALRAIHLAEDEVERRRARERLTFDEAVGLQWALVVAPARRAVGIRAPGAAAADGLAAELLQRLPFELTAGQREVLDVLSEGLAATRPMNRLLQGEVGSGKTIVAVLAMLQMVDAGYQCALLAPTEVLAAQHLRSINDVLGPLAMGGQLGGADNATRVALLTGSMSAAQKNQVRAEIASGQVGIVIGTHALLQDAVEFANLGMVVVDEQHRFGVEQRDRLRAKAPAGITPHLLVMTATPIPRTVALTVYGDLETSTLRELPARTSADHHQRHLRQGQARVAGSRLAAHHRRGRRRAARPTWWRRASTRPTEPENDGQDARPSATAEELFDTAAFR